MKLYEVKQYVDGDNGNAVTECKSLVDSKYQGTATVTVTMQGPQGERKMPQQLTFPILASTLEEAFSNFKSSLESHLLKIEEQRKASMNKIQIAQAVPQGNVTSIFEGKK